MKKLLVIISLAAGMAIFNSCGPSRYTVTEQPVAPVYERPVSPHPTYVWVEGDWRWHGGKYVYNNGYWSEPRGHRVYVTGNWQHTNKGYYWQKGYWK
jgi:WXXGXW repeat (2 copies)